MSAYHREVPPQNFQRFICRVCGFIYNEELGDPAYGIAPGTRFADIPDAWVCAMCGEPKSEFQLMTDAELAAAIAHPGRDIQEKIVIVGAGLAGWTAATEISRAASHVAISLVTMDAGDYYYKPNLSIAWSTGATTEKLILESGTAKAAKLGVDLVSHTQVVGIDRQKKQLITDQGFIPYNRLIIATGSKPRKLTYSRRQRIYSVNNLEEFGILQESLADYRNLVVIGGGLVGCEIADDLCRLEKHITILNQAPKLLAGIAPAPIADSLQSRLVRNGVTVLNNIQIAFIQNGDDGRLICQLDDGSSLEADAIVSCIGLLPNAAMAKLADLNVTNLGLQVDHTMRTSDPNIFALGDCADAGGVALRYVEAITAQAKVIADQFVSQSACLVFEPKRSLIKIKTRSYPIWISQSVSAQPYTGWRVIAQQDDHFHLELLQGETPCGYALSGIFTHLPDMSLISSQFYGEIR